MSKSPSGTRLSSTILGRPSDIQPYSPKKFGTTKSKVAGNLKSQKQADVRKRQVEQNAEMDALMARRYSPSKSALGVDQMFNHGISQAEIRRSPDMRTIDPMADFHQQKYQSGAAPINVEQEIQRRLEEIKAREAEIRSLQQTMIPRKDSPVTKAAPSSSEDHSRSVNQTRTVMDLEHELEQDDDCMAINAAMQKAERPRQYTVHDEQAPVQQSYAMSATMKEEVFSPQQSLSTIQQPAKPATTAKKSATKKRPTAVVPQAPQRTYSPLKTMTMAQSFATISRPGVPSHVVKKKKKTGAVSPLKKPSTPWNESSVITSPVNRTRVTTAKSPAKRSVNQSQGISPSPKAPVKKEIVLDSSDTNAEAEHGESVMEMKAVPHLRVPQVNHGVALSASDSRLQEIATLEEEFNRIMVERGQQAYIARSPSKNDLERQEFYKMMGDVYDPATVKRHVSPTKRLIQQKNSTSSHKELLNSEVRRRGYNLHYTTAPGKSHIVEPKGGALPYNLAYKNPDKFYDYVMRQEVKTHKVVDAVMDGKNVHHIICKIGQRKIGKIMMSIQDKLLNALREGNDEWEDQDLQNALQDSEVKEKVQGLIRKKTIELVDPQSNQPILKDEMRLIGEEGDKAIAQSPELAEASKEGEQLEQNLANAQMRINDAQDFKQCRDEINEFIRKNSIKK